MKKELQQLETAINELHESNDITKAGYSTLKFALEQVKNINYDAVLASRYFAVAYIGTHPMGKLTGLLDITTNGQYLNRALAIENIKEQNSELSSIVITNVIEMTKEDFDSWANEC